MEAALKQFSGHIMQTPPQFSALKVNGQRAYDLARAGKVVELKPRAVTVYSNELTSYEYPFVTFTSSVSSGTYVRSLVEDIGAALSVGAYMSDLRRTTVGERNIADAVSVKDLNQEIIEKALEQA